MTTPKIYVALSTFAQQSPQPLELLKASGYPFAVNTSGVRLSQERLVEQAHDFDGIVAGLETYDAKVLGALPRLKCISRCGAGVDNVDLPLARRKGIAVLNTPDVVIQPVAELTIAMIFDLLRRLTAHTLLMRQRKWERLVGWQLAGKRVGIIGLGRIGRKVAELLKKLDATVCGYDIDPDRAWAETQGITLVGIEELLGQCDILTLHFSASSRQPLCLNVRDLGRMKKGSFLVNVARGTAVDEQALVEALKSGHLAGAALDVYSSEPYAGPLCGMPNVILTPHVATLTYESRSAMEIEATQNILDFFIKNSEQQKAI